MRGYVARVFHVSLVVFVQVSLLGVHGSAVLELQLESFNNPGGKTWTNSLCPGIRRGPGKHKGPNSAYKFLICLDDKNGDSATCRYGQWDTGIFEADANVAFGHNMKGVANPIVKTIRQWPGSIKLKVKVVCTDEWGSHEEESSSHNNVQIVDVISTALSQTPSNKMSDMTSTTVAGSRTKGSGSGSNRRTSLSFSWRVYCQPDYFTAACDQHCPGPAPTDHYHCDETGTKRCDEGWTGDRCDINAHDCKDNPCQHDGECVDGDQTNTCVCRGDFTGPRCETTMDSCRSGPCLHGATCHRRQGDTYTCECTPTYKGVHCETHKCTGEPCENGATCYVRDGTAHCRCTAGYVGAHCDVDTCAYIECANDGMCVHGRCSCSHGYTGHLCTDRDVMCAVPPCVGATSQPIVTVTLVVGPTVDAHTDAFTSIGHPVKLEQVKHQIHKSSAIWILALIVIGVVAILILVIAVAAWLLLRANRKLQQQKAHMSLVLTNSNSSAETVSDYDTTTSVHRYASLARYTSLFAGHPVDLPPYDAVSHANTVTSGAYENPDYLDDQPPTVAGSHDKTDDVLATSDNNTGNNTYGESATTQSENTEHVYLELISD